ncbi:MAG TPA: HAMP domain-containing sensor histidine kinase [Bacteroidales bacterium]|nr:HAMP domain-containing sensor histidine kinase [Bacteroidales bacterium]
MKKKLTQFIIILTTLSLLGIVVSQIIWVDRAIKLRTGQFNFMVQSSLSKIESQLNTYKEDILLKNEPDSGSQIADTACLMRWFNDGFCEVIDTMMYSEFGHFNPSIEYAYGVVDTNTKELICGNYTIDNAQQIIDSKHKVLLSRLEKKKGYAIAVYFENERNIIIRKMFLWLLILSGGFLLVVIICFLYIIFSLWRQRKISEMKNDFINNMTHELKTPISTISVAAEMLMKPMVSENCDKTRKYANIIFDENMRLRNQVEQVLQMSVLDHNEFHLNLVLVNVHKVIENSVDIYNLIIKEKGGIITKELDATQTIIKADELHFINIVTNMLDNAIKYSSGAPVIKITTLNRDNGIAIVIEDNGLGISANDQKQIFKKFYRVYTGDIHNVKGFGLGLFYVKSVVDAHQGTVSIIRSELNKGSVFELFFPFNFNKINNDEHNSE